MSELVIHALVAIGGLASIQSGALQYIRSIPPMPEQSTITCKDQKQEQKQLISTGSHRIHVSLAPLVQQLQLDSQQQGHTLIITSAYRTCELQSQLRAASCGIGEYNMTKKPIKDCSPPTEPPGRSLHNEGLAIDFACQGYSFFQGSPCHQWLRAHGLRYHLQEHELEPWHWSTTGK